MATRPTAPRRHASTVETASSGMSDDCAGRGCRRSNAHRRRAPTSATAASAPKTERAAPGGAPGPEERAGHARVDPSAMHAEHREGRRQAGRAERRSEGEQRPGAGRVGGEQQHDQRQAADDQQQVRHEAEVDHAEDRWNRCRAESTHAAHPFSPLVAMPSTKYRWPSRKITAIGSTEMHRAGMISA